MTNSNLMPPRNRGERKASRRHRLRGTFASTYSASGLLIMLVISFDLLFVTSSFVLTQYFGEDVATSTTYFVGDGQWSPEPGGSCDPATEAVGFHCFGDYYFATRFAERADPWAPYLDFRFNYPAGSLLPHRVFGAIGNALGQPRVGLFLYMAALVASLATPAVWASRGKAWHRRAAVIALFGVASVPGVIALDRANSVALAVAPLLGFLVALRRGNERLTIGAIIIAALIKPQFVVLLLVLVGLRKWRGFAVGLAGVAVTQVLAFVAWPSRFPHTIPESLTNVLNYGQGTALSSDFPTNVSFARGVYVVGRGILQVVGVAPDEKLVMVAKVVGAVFAMGCAAIVMIVGRRIDPWLSGVALIVVASLFATTSFSYYLVFAIPVAAILLRDPLKAAAAGPAWEGVLEPPDVARGIGKASTFALVCATAATITRVVLPIHISSGITGMRDLLATSGDYVPALWAIALTMALWSNLSRRSHSIAETDSSGPTPEAPRATEVNELSEA